MRFGVVALLAGQYTSREQHACTHDGGSGSRFDSQQFVQPFATFCKILARVPELENRGPQPQAPLPLIGLRQPIEGSAKIVVLQFEQVCPLCVSGATC